MAKSQKINKVAEKSNNVTETVVPSDTVVMAPAVSNVITDVRAVKNIDTDTDSDTTNAVPDGSDPADVKVANEPTDSNAPDNRPSSSDSGPFLNPLPPLIDLSSLPGWNTTAAKGRKPRPLNAGNNTSRVPSKGLSGNNGVPGTRSFSSCNDVGLLAAGNNTSRAPSPVRSKGLPGNKGARSFSSCNDVGQIVIPWVFIPSLLRAIPSLLRAQECQYQYVLYQVREDFLVYRKVKKMPRKGSEVLKRRSRD